MDRKLSTDFTQGPVMRQLVLFALPFMAANLLQALYNVVDTIIVGRFVGSVGLSAVSIGGMITMFLTCISVGFSTGAQVLISQIMGKNDHSSINKAVGTIFSTMIALGLLTTVLGLALLNVFVRLMNTPAEAVAQTRAYLGICIAGIVMTFGYNGVSAVLRGMGDSKRPFVFIAIASVTNLVLDLIFVALLNMAAAGAALATIIGQTVSFVFSIVYLYRRRVAFGFDFRPASFRIDGALMKTFLKLGLPMTFQMAVVSVSYMVISSAVNSYGLAASAIAGVGSKLCNILNIVTGGIQTACAGMVGQNVSARKYDRVRSVTFSGLVVCTVSGIVFCGLCLLFPRAIISIFSTDADVLDLARLYMLTSVPGFMGSFLMAATNGLVQGSGAMTFNMVISALDCVVARLGLGFLLGNLLKIGPGGWWLGGSLAGYVTVIAGVWFLVAARYKRYSII